MAVSAIDQERFLLVKDDNLVRSYGQNQLEQLGYRMTAASTSPAILEIV